MSSMLLCRDRTRTYRTLGGLGEGGGLRPLWMVGFTLLPGKVGSTMTLKDSYTKVGKLPLDSHVESCVSTLCESVRIEAGHDAF